MVGTHTKKNSGAHVSISSSWHPLSLLLGKVMNTIPTLDTHTPQDFLNRERNFGRNKTVTDTCKTVTNFRHFSEGDALKNVRKKGDTISIYEEGRKDDPGNYQVSTPALEKVLYFPFRKKNLYRKGGEALEEVSQGGCGYTVPEGVQG